MMNDFKVFTVLAAFCACGALAAPAGQPVHILKQVNRQNDDGSYSYGFENADGTFKIETKYPTGEVYGKYGYVDETGKLRTVEYGASSARGFEPVGAGITVPPPAQSGSGAVESNDLHARDQPTQSQDDYDDGQYHEDPSIYYKSEQQQQQQQQQQIPAARQQQQWYSPAAAAGQKASRSDTIRQQQFQAHPSVQNFDPSSGSFSISYSG